MIKIVERIDYEQQNKLIELMIDKGIKVEWILGLCNIKLLQELTVKQYNYLLIFISNFLQERENK